MDNFIMYFTADWCEPCKNTRPIVETLNKENKNPKFFIIDADSATDMMKDFGITGVPTFVFIKNGEEVRREQGARTIKMLEEFVEYIEQ